MLVRDFYKKDCKDNICSTCRPTQISKTEYECSFANKSLITDFDEKIKILKDYGYSFPKERESEAIDYIREYPIFIIKKGESLCHSADIHRILKFKKLPDIKGPSGFYSTKSIWWNKYFVGQSKYGGGWFTYETSYGGPGFGLVLYYRVLEDIPILFVPNYRALEHNKDYFPEKHLAIDNEYTGSHIAYGVSKWKEKGYKQIVPEYFADEFAERINELGFPGYISCDECEVFINHKSMKKGLYERPYRIVYEKSLYINCDICKKKVIHASYCEQCKNKLPDIQEEDFTTIFHIIINALCPEKNECPLQINEGQRQNRIDMELLTKEKIEKIMPYEQFLQKHSKISI